MFVYRCHVKQFQKSIFCLSKHKLSELVHSAAGLLAPAYMLWTSILEIVSSYTIFSSLTSVASIIFESWVQHHFGNYWRHTTFGSPCIVNSWINTDKEKKPILFSLYGQSNWINDCTGSTENTLSAGQAAGVNINTYLLPSLLPSSTWTLLDYIIIIFITFISRMLVPNVIDSKC